MPITTLVSTAELLRHLDDPQWVILDCQHDLMNPVFGRESYAREHIPGARFISLDDDLADRTAHSTPGRGRHPLPSPEALAAVFGRLGIDAGKQVIVYDSSAGSYAARAWWCFRWLGHPAVAVLDGSVTKGKAEGRPLTSAVTSWTPTRFVAHPLDNLQVSADTVLKSMGNSAMRVIDARAPERFDGSAETIDPTGGHIPGAVNRFWKHNVNADSTFKSADQLRAEFASVLGHLPPTHLVHQCGSGVTACHNLLAMEITGLTGGKLYPGSWSEWCSDPSRPVATGP